MKKSKAATNTARKKAIVVRGTGKGHATSPANTHRKGGAVLAPRKSKGPMDNRPRKKSR